MQLLDGGEESLYDSVRSSAYAIKASVGWSGLIMYLILIYLLVKFLIMYFKRFLVVAILTFMAPIIGVTYSIDKIKDNKAQSLSNWLKEYTFNVIIQSVHALLYTLMVSLAFNIAGKSVMGTIIAVVLLNFVLKAEVIFKKIFRIKAATLKDALKSTFAVATGFKIAKNVASNNFKLLGKVTGPVTSPVKNIASRAKEYKRNDKLAQVKKAVEEARSTGNGIVKVGKNTFNIGELLNQPEFNSGKIAEDLVEKTEKIKDKNKEYMKQAMKETLNTIGGTAQAVAAIPVTVIDPEKGIMMASKARSQLKKGINGYSKDNKRYVGKKGIKNLLTAGGYASVANLKRKNMNHMKDISNSKNNTQHEIAIKNAEKQIEKQRTELEKNTDKKELEKVIKSASATVPEEAIIDTVYIMHGIMDNEVNLKISQSEETTKQVDQKIDKISEDTKEISDLYKKIKEANASKDLYFEIDQEKFEKRIEKGLNEKVSKEKGKKKVSKEEIEKAYKGMKKEEKEELIKESLVKSKKKEQGIKDNLENIAKNSKDTKTLYANMQKLSKKGKKSIKIDQQKFEKDINKQLIGLISKENNKRKIDITKKDIENRFKNMTEEERKNIVEKTMLKHTKLTEEEKERKKGQKTGMNLDNVNEIIDVMKEKTGKKIDIQNYKNNFEQIIKDNIQNNKKSNDDNITREEIDEYIGNLTREELITQIKIAGSYQNSLKRDKSCSKEEYKEIIKNIEKMNYHKAQMKG